MSQPNLPDKDYIVRFVPWGRVRKDADDNVVGISAEAFRRREDEDGLSVNWLERAHENPAIQLAATATIFQNTMKVGAKARMAVANVGKFKDICAAHNSRVRIVHVREPDNDPHSEVRQLPRDNAEQLEVLATEAIVAHYRCQEVAARLS
ncbi:MAG TPA: hypothetical protein VL100_07375 [Croceibacterium sp.]|nr:hypothetical protein [Croceibacterium sp.]